MLLGSCAVDRRSLGAERKERETGGPRGDPRWSADACRYGPPAQPLHLKLFLLIFCLSSRRDALFEGLPFARG